jgi:OmpA-OmpF porin, OOP family
MGFKKLSFLYLSLLCTWYSQGQNLVPNPSFEYSTACPSAYSQITLCYPWYSATMGTPDYFDSCGIHYSLQVPANNMGYQLPHTGAAYACIYASQRRFKFNVREYLTAPLIRTLTKGTFYYVSFYVSLADTSAYGTNKLGAFFSDTNFAPVQGYLMLAQPQVLNKEGNSLINNKDWVQVEGMFEAKGHETHISIGNFFNDTTAGYIANGVGHRWDESYYYLDDVLVTPCDSSNGRCLQFENSEISVFPNPSNGRFTVLKGNTRNISLKVYNDIGQLVFTQDLSARTSAVDLEDFSEGIYILRFFEGDYNVLNQKVLRAGR